jgi:hypothetical protein
MRRGRRVRLLACLGVTIMFMSHTLWHMFNDVRPFDWVMLIVEVAVLLLILYEVIVGAVRSRQEKQRQAKLDAIVASLAKQMDEGHSLQVTTPSPQLELAKIREWIQSVRAWSHATEIILKHYSLRAVRAFTLVVNANTADTVVHPSEGVSFYVAGEFREAYQRLLAQLDNLRRIIEKPEVYFDL